MPAVKPGQYIAGYSGITPDDIAKHMKATFDATDTEVCTEAIEAVEIELARLTGRNFAYMDGEDRQEYYQVFNGGLSRYDLLASPVDTIKKIELDGEVVYDIDDETKPYVLGTDFYVSDRMIEFAYKQMGGLSNKNVLKVYWTIQEFWGADVRLAIKKWVADIMRERETNGKNLKKFSFSGLTYEYDNKETQSAIDRVISNYSIPFV